MSPLLISADSHLMEPLDLWTTHLPPHLRPLGPRLEMRGEGACLMHPIVVGSPLFAETAATLEAARAEIVVSLIGFEETFAQTVHARHAYAMEEVVWNARFVDILSEFPDGRRRVDYTHFHDVAGTASGDAP